MTAFKFTHDWVAAGHDKPEIIHTMTNLALHIGNINLMQNEDIWAKTIRESVLVSAYPLAMWLVSSWWRLNFETLPARTHGVAPPIDWRMAHEMGAANHGFVWPTVIFASDGEVMKVWAKPSNGNIQQSVRYLNGLAQPTSIQLADFQRCVEDFIASVLSRLDAVGCPHTDLRNFWQLLQEERADPLSFNYRRLEAQFGYDPDECPEAMMGKAQALEQQMGAKALSELAPLYGKIVGDPSLNTLEEMINSPGLTATPNIPSLQQSKPTKGAPWQHAVAVARELWASLSKHSDVIENQQLYDLLGLSTSSVEQWIPPNANQPAAIAVPCNANRLKIVPRKKHPMGKRFELARLLGDYILTNDTDNQWLASTDLATSRQQYQRAFAAEFLCPIDVLEDFLQNDYSESAIEDATEHFQVSQETVKSLLINNGFLPPFMGDYAEAGLPYQLLV